MKNVKTKKKHGAGKAIAVVALSAIMLVGGGAVGYGAGTNWTYKRDTQSSSSLDDQGNTVVTPDEQNGIALAAKEIERKEFGKYGISEQADAAYILTAIFAPENTTDKRIRASLSFKNADSEWANGKTVTDYVSINIDQREIILTCLQAFGEQINLRVDTNYENVYATTTIDYIARSTDVTVGMGTLTQTGVGDYDKPVYTIGGDNSTMTFKQGSAGLYGVVPGFVKHGVGTLLPSVRLTKVELTFDQYIVTGCHLSDCCTVGYESVGEEAKISNGFNGNEGLGYAFTANQELLMQLLHSNTSNEGRVLAELSYYVAEGYPYITCKATCEVYYGDKVISTEVVSKKNILTYFSALFTPADNVTLDDNNIIF